MTTEPDDLDKIRAEDAANREAKVYESLEDDIMALRSTIYSQAILLREMDLSPVRNFLERILKLETLQQKYDAWDSEAEQAEFAEHESPSRMDQDLQIRKMRKALRYAIDNRVHTFDYDTWIQMCKDAGVEV